MDCDNVFDILTRGPFPTGTPIDEPVESHVATCADCRRLAEALRPAVALFQETIGPEESRELPGYWGELVEAAEERPWPRPGSRHRVAAAPLARLERTAQTARERWEAGGWRWVVAAAAGIAVAAMLQNGRLEGEAEHRSAAVVAEVEHAMASATHELMRSFADACKRRRGAKQRESVTELLPHGTLLALSAANERCCSECHTPAESRDLGIPQGIAGKVVLTCQACH